jgi:hypothetical protein
MAQEGEEQRRPVLQVRQLGLSSLHLVFALSNSSPLNCVPR